MPLDFEKISAGLQAKPAGRVRAGGGYFGALALAAEVQARFRVPPRGGRATNPEWTERRQVAMARSTLERLESISEELELHGVRIEPLQIAAVLLEREVSRLESQTVEAVVVREKPKPYRR